MDAGQNVRMEPKDRLMQAIREAGFEKPTDAWRTHKRRLGISQSLLINNANGNNAISKRAAAIYAKVFGHAAGWYLYGEPMLADPPPPVTPVPSLSIPVYADVPAGRMRATEGVARAEDVRSHIVISGLGRGNWAALVVNGHSMNKVAPDGSTIVFNRADTRPVNNAFYVFKDPETGAATFKRYGAGSPPWLRPYSYDDFDPIPVDGDIEIVGRVRKVLVDL